MPGDRDLRVRSTAAAQQPNLALAVLDCLTRAMLPMRTEQSELVWWQLDEGIKELIVILGKMERIRGMPYVHGMRIRVTVTRPFLTVSF